MLTSGPPVSADSLAIDRAQGPGTDGSAFVVCGERMTSPVAGWCRGSVGGADDESCSASRPRASENAPVGQVFSAAAQRARQSPDPNEAHSSIATEMTRRDVGHTGPFGSGGAAQFWRTLKRSTPIFGLDSGLG